MTRTRRSPLLLSLAAAARLLAPDALAQGPAPGGAAPGGAAVGGAAVGGAGNATCGDYMALVQKDGARADFVFQSWAQGFISGINFRALQDAASGGGELVDMNPRDYPPAQQLRFLHGWCALNPSEPVLSAVIALVADLRKAQVLGPRPPRAAAPPTE